VEKSLEAYMNYVCPYCWHTLDECTCEIYPPYERILFRGITMRKSAPINIIVHYPKTEEGMRELRRRVASVHADIVMDQIRKLDWPMSEKIRLVDAIIADAKAEMKKK